MFGSLGAPELIIIFVVALIVFGPRKLPELGRSLGKGLSEFKLASNDLRNTLDDEIRLEEHRTATAAAPAPPAIAPPVITSSVEEPFSQAEPFAPDDTVARGGRPS